MNNKFSFIANIKKEEIHKDLAKKVRYEINKYLFSIDCFSLMQGTDSLIFGGAVRDAIAGLEIHDVDIVVLPQAFQTISQRLSDAGFKKTEKYSLDITSLYNGITQIHEPINYVKNYTCVQLIRPRSHITLYNFVKNVDISCCAVSFFPNDDLIEHLPNAVDDCIYKKFHTIESAELFNKTRIDRRIDKLTKRGWTQYKTKEEKIICIDCANNSNSCGYFINDNTCEHYEAELPF